MPPSGPPEPWRRPAANALLAAAACLVTPAFAQLPATAPGRPEIPVARSAGPPDRSPPPEASAWTNLVIRPAGAGVFELGPVRFDRAARTATFPATINMLQGPVEYLIVSGYGKTHESILRTPAEPFHVHLAMLLMDAKAGTLPTNQSAAPGLRPSQQPGQILAPAAQPLVGDSVHVEVAWERGGQKVRQPASDFITNAREGRAMSDGPWTYSGGQVVQGFFTPQQTGSIAAVITDPDALINNPRAGHENDDIWLVNTNAIPPLNTPVQVIIQLR